MSLENNWATGKDTLSINLGEVSSLIITGAITLGLIGLAGSFFGGSE